nr:immunoglobulin heavy chain junction region [Macaca mulatta]MOY30165.1 immunoglobulin heavy chain junction region [Macaca mulatta]
CARLQSNFAYW